MACLVCNCFFTKRILFKIIFIDNPAQPSEFIPHIVEAESSDLPSHECMLKTQRRPTGCLPDDGMEIEEDLLIEEDDTARKSIFGITTKRILSY